MTSAYSESADWVQLGQQNDVPVYYKKSELYGMLWKNVDLDAVLIAAAPFGGPIATIRHPRKLIRLDGEGSIPNVRIYTASGYLLSMFPWDKKSSVHSMGWTEDERLCVLSEEGMVYMYSMQGEFVRLFTCGMNAETDSILEARFFFNSLAVVTKEHDILIIRNVHDPRPERYADLRIEEHPYCFEPIPGQFTLSTTIEVLVSPRSLPPPLPQQQPQPAAGHGKKRGKDKEKQQAERDEEAEANTLLQMNETGIVMVVDANESTSHQVGDSAPFLRFALSPNGQLLACFDSVGKLQVCKSDFSRRLSSFATKSKVPPRQLVWCGVDALVLLWDPEQLNSTQSLVLMVGPYGDFEKFTFDGAVHLVSEMDGVRIISNSSSEFLQRVPQALCDIFRIGSVEPAALLFDAYSEYERKSPVCIRNIRAIREQLSDAVDACIEAAAATFKDELQKQLLRAAAFGKSFCEFYSAESFVDTCRTLRVLNAIRDPHVGLPLTFVQYEKLTPEGVVQRLVERNRHLLAVRVCEWLKLKTDRVLVHWACQKVKHDERSDAEVMAALAEKLSSYGSIPYHEIASAAFKGGKQRLAIALLDKDDSAARQVPLLLAMGENDLALDKAVQSGDPDLVYICIFHIRENDSQEVLHNALRKRPIARDLYLSYCRGSANHEQLRIMLIEMDLMHEAGMAQVHKSFVEAIEAKDAAQALQSAAEDFSAAGKEWGPVARLVDEQVELLTLQQEYEAAAGQEGGFTFAPLGETIFTLLTMGDQKRAEKLRAQYKVSDKKFWWIKVRALGVSRNWDALEKFAKEKKSPIGYEPFVQVCLQNGNRFEGEKYVPKVTSARSRAELWIELGNFEEASQTAFAAKDTQMLEDIRQRCEFNRRLQAQVDQYLAKLQQP